MTVVTAQPPVDPTPRVGMLLHRASGLCLVGAGAIHLAAAPVHTDHDPAIGAFFWAAGVVQLLVGGVLVARGRRRLLSAAGIGCAGVVALWAVSRTVGVAGLSAPAEVEAIGLADGVATGLELAVVLAAALLARPALGLRRLPVVPAQAGLAALAMVIGAVTAPAVLAAPHHEHDLTGLVAGHSHEEAGPSQDHGHQHASPAGADTQGRHRHGRSTAFVFGEEDPHHSSSPCHPTSAQRAAAERLLAQTKVGLARLADVDVARNEGYMRYGDVAVSGTWHYINWEYEAEPDVLNPNKPESIVYWQATPDSPLLLIGAMYVMPEVDDRGPTIGGCLTRWHTHGQPFAPNGRLTNEMLHVWIVPLPNGPFV